MQPVCTEHPAYLDVTIPSGPGPTNSPFSSLLYAIVFILLSLFLPLSPVLINFYIGYFGASEVVHQDQGRFGGVKFICASKGYW